MKGFCAIYLRVAAQPNCLLWLVAFFGFNGTDLRWMFCWCCCLRNWFTFYAFLVLMILQLFCVSCVSALPPTQAFAPRESLHADHVWRWCLCWAGHFFAASLQLEWHLSLGAWWSITKTIQTRNHDFSDLNHLVFAFPGLALDNNLSHNVRRCIHTPYDVVAEPAVKALGDPHHKQLFTVAPVWYYFERIILPYNIVHRAQGKHKNKKH